MIDPRLLDDFMQRFFGYGSWSSKLWFVGMEEGGGESIYEIEARLRSWDKSDELADIRRFHSDIGLSAWFCERPKIQNTWGKLVRVALTAQDKPSDTESVRRYQRDERGRRDGSEALIELLPLPSPSTADWIYGSLGIAAIATRERYRNWMLPVRIAAIRERIARHRPEVVVFYGIGYRPQWEGITRNRFVPVRNEHFEIASNGTTRFVLAPHPVSTGVSNADFEAIGRWIRNGLGT